MKTRIFVFLVDEYLQSHELLLRFHPAKGTIIVVKFTSRKNKNTIYNRLKKKKDRFRPGIRTILEVKLTRKERKM